MAYKACGGSSNHGQTFTATATGEITSIAGAAVRVKLSLGDNQNLNIPASGSPSSQAIGCSSSAPTNAIEETVSAGSSGLSCDAAADTYTYVWKTQKVWAGTCRQLTVTLADGTQRTASFRCK